MELKIIWKANSKKQKIQQTTNTLRQEGIFVPLDNADCKMKYFNKVQWVDYRTECYYVKCCKLPWADRPITGGTGRGHCVSVLDVILTLGLSNKLGRLSTINAVKAGSLLLFFCVRLRCFPRLRFPTSSLNLTNFRLGKLINRVLVITSTDSRNCTLIALYSVTST